MPQEQNPQSEVMIACDPNAIFPGEQERWLKEVLPKLYPAVEEIRELPDGWAWRLPASSEMLLLVAEDLNFERLCCPFVRYTLELEPDRGPFWLRMTGGGGVKDFLRMAFETSGYFDPLVARAAGLNLSPSPEMDSVQTALEIVEGINERYARASGSGL
jgi:hypothetical protein